VTRESELPEIEQFLAAKGATRCSTVYVHPTSTNFSAAEEAHRLGREGDDRKRPLQSFRRPHSRRNVRRLGRPDPVDGAARTAARLVAGGAAAESADYPPARARG
jgi:hypothetical protein